MKQLTNMLETTFFEAHARQKRIIELQHVQAAAVAISNPKRLELLRQRTESICAVAERDNIQVGDYVEVSSADKLPFRFQRYAGKRGVVKKKSDSKYTGQKMFQNTQAELSYDLLLDDGGMCTLSQSNMVTSGMSEPDYRQAVKALRGKALTEECDELPMAMQEAVKAVHTRVAQDRLPLLSLLEASPLLMQSSHLSFQEFYTALGICQGHRLPEGNLPWQFGPWWGNTLRLGQEMNGFGLGLKKASGCADVLNLDGIDGRLPPSPSRTMAVLGIAQIMPHLQKLVLCNNTLEDKDAVVLAAALVKCESEGTPCSLQELDLSENNIRCAATTVWHSNGQYDYTPFPITTFARFLRTKSLTWVDMRVNPIDGDAKTAMKEVAASVQGRVEQLTFVI